MCTSRLHTRIESILEFLDPYWEFVNCHMVTYLKDNHWNKFIPERLRSEVANDECISKCIETVFWKNFSSNDFPEFSSFVRTLENFRIENFPDIVTPVTRMNEILQNDDKRNNIHIKEFLSEKKCHEVEVMSEFIHDLMCKHQRDNSNDQLFIVDAGDGKGYLSSRLALQYGYRVLGIDSSQTNTINAVKRSDKLKRVWDGLIKRVAKCDEQSPTECGGIQQDDFQLQQRSFLSNYKTSTNLITSKLNISQLLDDNFGNTNDVIKEYNYCLIGLHTCGNLASNCLKIFESQTNCKILCNVGCCYHLLKEANVVDEFYGKNVKSTIQEEIGFPMSKFLNAKKVKLGRNARMLASQAIQRILNSKQLPHISLFYRALLEVLLSQVYQGEQHSIQVGKVKDYNSFINYVEQCNKRTPLPLKIFDEVNLVEMEKQNESHRKYLNLFYLIRMLFGSVLESLILLDRVLYLKEMGFENTFLVPLFDTVISPRSCAIVAFK